MPVWLDRGPLGCRLFTTGQPTGRNAAAQFAKEDRNRIELGLVNNMSDSALEQTERQILKLLHAASDGLSVRLRLYALPGVPRGDWGREHLHRLRYFGADDLWNSNLDGLIVTGAEPRTADLREEPYWRELTEAFVWADENTMSTVTSCLAVHAAVLHFDGVDRRSLNEKCFGIVDLQKVSDHCFVKGIPQRLVMPHSRWNELEQKALLDCGYEILTASLGDGVDMFVKRKASQFVFFQGHPEYEAWTLLGEFRRDTARFLSGERETFPAMPLAYFDRDSTAALEAFRDRAVANPDKELMAAFPTDRLTGRLSDPWRQSAVQIYSNWLQWLAAQKSERTRPIAASMGSATSSAR